jgi:hypothetical protein
MHSYFNLKSDWKAHHIRSSVAMVYFAHTYALAASAALLPAVHAASSDRTFEERCSAFASELDLANVTVHFSQYLTKGSNLSLSEFVSL